MPTVVLNAQSSAYPSITNPIRAAVASASNPLALIASETDTTSGHPQRTWSFPGLPRQNYTFRLDEVDGSGNILSNLALFSVVPSEIDGLLSRNDEQIKADITPGFVSGANNFIMNGASGKPDYRGWDIVPSELTGRGILVRGQDYSWDEATGTLALLIPGDAFPEEMVYNIHFNPNITGIGNSYPIINDLQVKHITSSETLLAEDFGKIILCEPTGYIEVTLPNISTIPEGRRLYLENNGSGVSTVKIIPYSGNVIKFARGSIYILPNESIEIYNYNGYIYCRNAVGNYLDVGGIIRNDLPRSSLFNVKRLDGSIELVSDYSRIYNEIVINLPVSQVVNFDDWSSSPSNSTKYSLANSSNPANVGKFRFPMRMNLFSRASLEISGDPVNSTISGDYQHTMILDHDHLIAALSSNIGAGAETSAPGVSDILKVLKSYGNDDSYKLVGISNGNAQSPVLLSWKVNMSSSSRGGECRPITYVINEFVKI